MEKRIKTLGIISIIIVLLFIALSALDCIVVQKAFIGNGASFAYEEERPEPEITRTGYNNQFFKVLLLGLAEVLFLVTGCFMLSIASAAIQLFFTVGTLCTGLLEQMLQAIGSQSITTFEITPVGYAVAVLAGLNVLCAIVLQVLKKKQEKWARQNGNDNIPWEPPVMA